VGESLICVSMFLIYVGASLMYGCITYCENVPLMCVGVSLMSVSVVLMCEHITYMGVSVVA